MINVKKLTVEEQNTIDVITSKYELPFEIFEEETDNGYGNDFIQDTESEEMLDLYDGVSQILEAINCDDRELFHQLTKTTQEIFLNLCEELEII